MVKKGMETTMESNRFEEIWNSGRERIFPDWNSDIRELISESRSNGDLRVEVIMDRMDGREFFSLFDYEGGNIAEYLGGSGSVAVMSPRSLIRRYRSQMKRSQPIFRFYRIAANVSDVLRMKHPDIAAAPDTVFDESEEKCIADPGKNRILFKKDAVESADTYFSLFVMLRRLWQTNRMSAQKGSQAGPDLKTDALAFAVLMMDVLFQIDYAPEQFADDELSREKVRRRTIELAEELYG
ncbi:MAG: hypothetical protein II643_04810 [Oscillospiraceae bacterium]|nr:hypothetical protein [Oscillospiraceae bacterium]